MSEKSRFDRANLRPDQDDVLVSVSGSRSKLVGEVYADDEAVSSTLDISTVLQAGRYTGSAQGQGRVIF